jgi:hypothetical protein
VEEEEGKKMAYHPLTNESGGDDSSRRGEAAKLVSLLEPYLDEMTPTQRRFVEQMSEGGPVSTKQIFWLRDLVERHC